MARPTTIQVKQTAVELKQILKKQPLHLQKRIQMLLLIKEGKHSSKYDLAIALSVNPNSIQTWRSKYTQGGIKSLLVYNRTSHKKRVITPELHKAIEKKLTHATEAFRSFEELRSWIDEKYIPFINYHTVNKYVKKHFGAKLKVSRKSHVARSEQAVSAFKKTPVPSSRAYYKQSQ
jgi:transposase